MALSLLRKLNISNQSNKYHGSEAATCDPPTVKFKQWVTMAGIR